MTDRVIDVVRGFFAAVDAAALELPDGWFGGRPYDTYHELTFTSHASGELVLELDGLQTLTFVGGDVTARADDRELMLAGYAHAQLGLRSSSTGEILDERLLRGGHVRFAVPGRDTEYVRTEDAASSPRCRPRRCSWTS